MLAKSPPNPEALALGPTIGWLLFGCALAFAAVMLLDWQRWRRFWLRTEDPRAIAAFRVAFCGVLLININNMWPHFELLFTDEGLFTTEAARQVLGGRQFLGYGEAVAGDPPGFFGFDAWLEWLRGPRYSLLLFWDSPTAFYLHLAAWELATLAFMVGFRTRISGFVSLFLTLSIMGRNPIYMSGADTVFRVMFVYLVLARSGHAYSVDNWMRCRRLAARGQLEAIYRRIPAWPRTLIILQLAVVYLWTGSAKTGHVWARGDSLYYALNLDHFNRVPMQFIGSVFGTNLFRMMTWTVHFWQIGFPLVVLGLIVRWARREQLEPPSGWRRWGLRAAWSLLWLGALAIVWVGLPVHVPVGRPGMPDVRVIQWLVAGGWLLLGGVGAWAWVRMRERPFRLTLRGHTLVLDLERFFTIVAGRRLWLTLGVIFHLHIFALMNIGMFAPVMIVVYIACLNGTEVAALLEHVRRALVRLRVPGIRARDRIIPTESTALPHLHHDNRQLPVAVVFAAAMFVTAGVIAKVQDQSWAAWLIVAGFALPLVFALLMRARLGRPAAPSSPDALASAPTWAYGWFGRTLISAFIAAHVTALAAYSIPDKDCTASFRKGARELASPWVRGTQTYQSWEMFAPNPTRANVFMKVYVTDQDGEVWDLYTDANSPRNKVEPWLIYDRMGKITRRITGDGKHYQKWVARYHCRKWALEHGGELPRSVEIIKQWYVVPPPETVRERGPYRPAEFLAAHGKQERVHRIRCATEPEAQPTNELRRRHGLPELPDAEIRRAARPRLEKWQARQRERDGEQDDDGSDS